MKIEPWSTYLGKLRTLPPVRGVKSHPPRANDKGRGWDGLLEIETSTAHHHLLVEEKRGTINAAMEERILSLRGRRASMPWILFAPRVTSRLAERLAAENINFIDQAGNCHLELPPGVLIHIVGRAFPQREPRSALTLNGYRVLMSLLVAPRLLNASVRELALNAGVGKSTASDSLKALAAGGLLHVTRKGKVLEGSHLLDRWVAGYADQIRPSLVLARYHSAEKDLRALQERGEYALKRHGVRWAFTGGVAAQRLTGHYRGDTTTIHLEHPVPELARELRLAPSSLGSVTVLGTPSNLIFEEMPLPGTAPAALVYAELLTTGGERAREAAEIVRSRYLPGFL